jgi:hypothetical protein
MLCVAPKQPPGVVVRVKVGAAKFQDCVRFPLAMAAEAYSKAVRAPSLALPIPFDLGVMGDGVAAAQGADVINRHGRAGGRRRRRLRSRIRSR